MNKQTLIVFAGGLFIVLIAALLTQSLLQEENVEEQAIIETVKTPTEILVAAEDVTIGDEVDSSNVKWMSWPEGIEFTGATIRGGDIAPESVIIPTGKTRRNIKEGQIILATDLAQDDTGNFVAATLGDGMRAYTIEVNSVTGISGFLKPGDFVDIILTYDVRIPADDDIAQAAVSVVASSSSQTLLENIRVMAIDQTATEIEGIQTARTVTLEVDPKKAEKLALASQMGTLSLSLRKPGDSQIRTADGNRSPSVTDVRLSDALSEVMGGNNELMTVYSLGEKRSIFFLGGNSDIDELQYEDVNNEIE